MGCEHASTTVLLHLFGESPEGYEAHLAQCEECQEALAEHAVTVGVVEGVFRRDEVSPRLDDEVRAAAPAAEQPPRPVITPLERRKWVRWVAAAAAAVALAWGVTLLSNDEEDAFEVAEVDAEADAWEDPIELELDLITQEFDSLSRELEEL